mmetsp:Transcript_10483/g.48095  ORF Transcript_10483/g.48095 Transcript_10483/m.48095 type:complete len:230 (+) Transcript_10483:5008-5697(+)
MNRRRRRRRRHGRWRWIRVKTRVRRARRRARPRRGLNSSRREPTLSVKTPTDARSSRRASPTSRACGLTRWTRGRPGGSSRGPTRSSIPRTTPSQGRERTRRWPGWSERICVWRLRRRRGSYSTLNRAGSTWASGSTPAATTTTTIACAWLVSARVSRWRTGSRVGRETIRRKPSLKSASWRTSSWNWTTRADERVWAPGTSGPRYGRCTRHSWTRWELVRYRASAADR